MKQRILQVITSLLLIITLTMANFLLLCIDVVSYAAEEINADKNTNHKNIEFMAYFKDEKGNKVAERDAYTNNNDLKVYFQVSVKKEGYFNGNIVLKDSNFKLKTDSLSDGISKIENNIIYLNQINAGESKEFEVGIELLKDEQFDLNLINMKSKVSVEGIYKDSTRKDISIKAERNLNLKFISPYTAKEENIILSQKTITNKILKFNGNNKRIIQVEVSSGLYNNLFPISKTIINIHTPKISNKYPEEVLVNSNDVLMTNGKMLSKDNWSYNKESGILDINLENKKEGNKVSWVKTGEDKIIVTYIFDESVEVSNEKLNVNSKIELYDLKNTVMEASSENTLGRDEKNTIVTSNINQYETSIYKGKLYSAISRNITYKNNININLNNVADEINVKEEKQTINEQVISSVYKTTKVKKEDIENIFGENGSLDIINSETGNVITSISKSDEADENGDIIVTYPENINAITIRLVQPEKIGKLEVETTKTINAIDKNLVKNGSSIEQKNTVSYISEDKENKIEETKSNIDLKETETSINLDINRTDLSTMTTNNNVEFRITLDSKEEKNELFKNPVLRLELPEKIRDIQVNSIKLLYEDEMKIKSATLKDKIIEIALEGEQTEYKEEAIDGAIIIIDANLTTSTKIPSSTEQVKLTYTNQNAINYKDGANVGTDTKDINIVSYAGIVTTNQIDAYGIELVNNEGKNSAQLDVSTDTKNVSIQKKIINNKENKISNVKILGTFPTKDAISQNTIDMEVGNIVVSGIDSSRVKVYYSNNEAATEDLQNRDNNWTENIGDAKNVKKYLVVIDSMDLLEEIDLDYNIVIPSNLEYNESAEEGYNVYYDDDVTLVPESVKVNNLRLSTGKGPVMDTTLKAYVGGEELSDVKEGEFITYSIVASNTGTEEIQNIKLTGKIPENTVYVENNKPLKGMSDTKYEPIIEHEDKENVEFNIEKLSPGQSINETYQVKVNDNTEGKNVSNSIMTQYGDLNKTSNEVTNSIKKGELKAVLYSADNDGVMKEGYPYRYVLKIKNLSNTEKKNVKVNAKISDGIKLNEIFYISKDGETVREQNNNYINISSIKAGEEVSVEINIEAEGTDMNSEKAMITANVEDGNIIYHANSINTIIKKLDVQTVISSTNSDNYVKSGDEIQYTIGIKNNGDSKLDKVLLKDVISNKVTLSEITKNNQLLSSDNYNQEDEKTTGGKIIEISDGLDAGEQVEYKVKVLVNKIPSNKVSIEIVNNISIYANSIEIANKEIKHILGPEKQEDTSDSDGKTDSNPTDNPDDTPNQSDETDDRNIKSISGIVWVDENGDGKKDTNEQLLNGVTVKLLNVKTNEFVKDSKGSELTTTTSESGFYSFDEVVKGEYMVIFEYDTSKYILTTYEGKGIDNKDASKVISRKMTINGEEKTVGGTEIITIDDANIANVNMGLQVAKSFDLKLDKYVSKVVTQNSKGTKTVEYQNETFAKAEIDAKQVNATTAIVEYTIKVTNVGEVDAYAKKIIDYIPKDYKFTSDLNKDWYQLDDKLYNSSLSNEKIKPGESREIKLIVTKQMKEDNTGLIHNTAEIVESYNDLGLKDENDNNSNSADLILSIKTGQVVTTITLILSSIIIIGTAMYIIGRFVLTKRII